jgi:hypothetical protein
MGDPNMIFDFRERAAIFVQTVRAALSPPHTSRAPGFATLAVPERKIRMLRKATPRTWRLLWQTYSARSATVRGRPEGQAAPPHGFNLAEGLSAASLGLS